MKMTLDFIAGFFDADGCVAFSKRDAPTLRFYNDSYEILSTIAESLSLRVKPMPREKPRGGISYTLTICRREKVLEIARKFIVCGCIVKKERLERTVLVLKDLPLTRFWTEREDDILWKYKHLPIKELMKLTGRTWGSVMSRRKLLRAFTRRSSTRSARA